MDRNDLPPPLTPAELPPDAPRGLMARFRNYFLTGLVVAGPIAITFYLTWWFVNWVDSLVRPFVPIAYRPELAFRLRWYMDRIQGRAGHQVEADCWPAPRLRIPDHRAKRGRRADPSEGDAGYPYHGRRARRVDARAVE